MPITRHQFMLCMLLPATAAAQFKGPSPGPFKDCSTPRPVECQVNAPVFDFGRRQMLPTSPDINGRAIISVTCVKSPDESKVDVDFELQAQPPAPARQMRNQVGGYLGYDMFLDPARLQYWGDGSQGTFTITGQLKLDNNNRVGTLVYPLYGRVPGGQQSVLPGQWLGAVVSRVLYTFKCK